MKRNKLGIIVDQWNGDKPYLNGNSISKHYDLYNKNRIFITRVNNSNEIGTIYLGFFIEIKLKK